MNTARELIPLQLYKGVPKRDLGKILNSILSEELTCTVNDQVHENLYNNLNRYNMRRLGARSINHKTSNLSVDTGSLQRKPEPSISMELHLETDEQQANKEDQLAYETTKNNMLHWYMDEMNNDLNKENKLKRLNALINNSSRIEMFSNRDPTSNNTDLNKNNSFQTPPFSNFLDKSGDDMSINAKDSSKTVKEQNDSGTEKFKWVTEDSKKFNVIQDDSNYFNMGNVPRANTNTTMENQKPFKFFSGGANLEYEPTNTQLQATKSDSLIFGRRDFEGLNRVTILNDKDPKINEKTEAVKWDRRPKSVKDVYNLRVKQMLPRAKPHPRLHMEEEPGISTFSSKPDRGITQNKYGPGKPKQIQSEYFSGNHPSLANILGNPSPPPKKTDHPNLSTDSIWSVSSKDALNSSNELKKVERTNIKFDEYHSRNIKRVDEKLSESKLSGEKSVNDFSGHIKGSYSQTSSGDWSRNSDRQNFESTPDQRQPVSQYNVYKNNRETLRKDILLEHNKRFKSLNEVKLKSNENNYLGKYLKSTTENLNSTLKKTARSNNINQNVPQKNITKSVPNFQTNKKKPEFRKQSGNTGKRKNKFNELIETKKSALLYSPESPTTKHIIKTYSKYSEYTLPEKKRFKHKLYKLSRNRYRPTRFKKAFVNVIPTDKKSENSLPDSTQKENFTNNENRDHLHLNDRKESYDSTIRAEPRAESDNRGQLREKKIQYVGLLNSYVFQTRNQKDYTKKESDFKRSEGGAHHNDSRNLSSVDSLKVDPPTITTLKKENTDLSVKRSIPNFYKKDSKMQFFMPSKLAQNSKLPNSLLNTTNINNSKTHTKFLKNNEDQDNRKKFEESEMIQQSEEVNESAGQPRLFDKVLLNLRENFSSATGSVSTNYSSDKGVTNNKVDDPHSAINKFIQSGKKGQTTKKFPKSVPAVKFDSIPPNSHIDRIYERETFKTSLKEKYLNKLTKSKELLNHVKSNIDTHQDKMKTSSNERWAQPTPSENNNTVPTFAKRYEKTVSPFKQKESSKQTKNQLKSFDSDNYKTLLNKWRNSQNNYTDLGNKSSRDSFTDYKKTELKKYEMVSNKNFDSKQLKIVNPNKDLYYIFKQGLNYNSKPNSSNSKNLTNNKIGNRSEKNYFLSDNK